MVFARYILKKITIVTLYPMFLCKPLRVLLFSFTFVTNLIAMDPPKIPQIPQTSDGQQKKPKVPALNMPPLRPISSIPDSSGSGGAAKEKKSHAAGNSLLVKLSPRGRDASPKRQRASSRDKSSYKMEVSPDREIHWLDGVWNNMKLEQKMDALNPYQDGYGHSPLILAIQNFEKEQVSYLLTLQNTDLNHKDFDGNTALHHAVFCRDIDIFNLIMMDPRCNSLLCNRKKLIPLSLLYTSGYDGQKFANPLAARGAIEKTIDNFLLESLENLKMHGVHSIDAVIEKSWHSLHKYEGDPSLPFITADFVTKMVQVRARDSQTIIVRVIDFLNKSLDSINFEQYKDCCFSDSQMCELIQKISTTFTDTYFEGVLPPVSHDFIVHVITLYILKKVIECCLDEILYDELPELKNLSKKDLMPTLVAKVDRLCCEKLGYPWRTKITDGLILDVILGWLQEP